MDEDDILLALENRRSIYLSKRDGKDALADDTLNEWEKFGFAAEVCEVIALELGTRLPERKDEAA